MDTLLSNIITNPFMSVIVAGLGAISAYNLQCWWSKRKKQAELKDTQAKNNLEINLNKAKEKVLNETVELKALRLLNDLMQDVLRTKLRKCSTWAECWDVMEDFESVLCISHLAEAWQKFLPHATDTSTLEKDTLEWVWQGPRRSDRLQIVRSVDAGLHVAIERVWQERECKLQGVYHRTCEIPARPFKRGEPPALTALRMFVNYVPASDFQAAFGDCAVTQALATRLHRTPEQLRETLRALKQLELSPAMRVARSLRGPAPASVKDRAREAFVHDRTVESQPFSREKERELQEAVARLDYLDVPDAYPDIHRELYPDADNTPQAKPN